MGAPRRQVHFAEDAAPTRPIAIPQRTPSSPASSLSSAGPFTPPTATFYHSHIVPLPPVTPMVAALELDRPASASSTSSSLRTHLHSTTPVPVSALLAAAANGGKPRLKWDMQGDPLRWMFDRDMRQPVLSLLLDEPAASPDVARIVIIVSGALYPYEIVAERPTALTAPLYVSVRDVLVAVYDNLRRVVSAAEQQGAAQQNARAWRAATDAHRRRAAGSASEPMRRVDFLAGRTVFLGLVSKGVDGKVPRLGLRVGLRDS